jgi:hypothetical protein
VDAGAWQNSGAIVSGLLVGSHTVSFSPLSGWTPPARRTVAITAKQTNSISVGYSGAAPPNDPVGTTGSAPVENFNAALAGTYNGLFYPANTMTDETSGMLTGLIVRSNGRYSGSVLTGGRTLAVSGTFDVAGNASQVIARGPRAGGALILSMAFTQSGTTPAIVGTVSGTNGGLWVANLNAVQASASPQSGRDTLLFAPGETASAGSPPGFGYATVNNQKGIATLVGALADGASFSRNVKVSANGLLPLYLRFGPGELALGWITNLYSQTPGGNIAWIKLGSLTSLDYREGFTNVANVMGSVWTNAEPEHPAIDLVDAPLTVFDSGWTEPVNYMVTVAPNNTVGATGGAPEDAVTGTVNPRTGLLQLKINCGEGQALRRAYGAVLQTPGVAGGYFMTQTNTGAFELNPILFE